MRTKYLTRINKVTNPEINRKGICAIYFLINKGVIIYIGQTTNLKSRICTHKSYESYYFESFRFILCDEGRLMEYETRWLQRFRPILNSLLYNGTRKGSEYDKNIITRELSEVIV